MCGHKIKYNGQNDIKIKANDESECLWMVLTFPAPITFSAA